MPGPMVGAINIFFINFPFTPAGLLSSNALRNALIFSSICVSVNDNFPTDALMFPDLSSLNSILPFLNSSTACGIFATTVPAFGDGISPFGPSCLATGARSLICSGVVSNTSKLNFHAFMSLSNVSVPAISAQAFFASASSAVNTAILLLFPVP